MTFSNKDLPHPAAPEADQPFEGGIPTEKNWVDFATDRYSSPSQFLAYMHGIQDMTNSLEIIIQKSSNQSIEIFKQQIEEFCLQQRTFTEHVNQLPSPGDVWY